MPTDRGLRSRSGVGGGAAVIRASTIQHAASVASRAATTRAALDVYQQPPKASHRARVNGTTHAATARQQPQQQEYGMPTYTEHELAHIADAETHAADCLCTICSCGKHQ